MVGEGSESRVEHGRRDRDQRDEGDRADKDAGVDRLVAEAHARQERPVRHQERRIDELQHMAAAPEQFVARGQLPPVREQRPGDAKADQRQNVDEAGERHRDRERRRGLKPSRQIEEEANDRRQHAERQRQKPEIIGRMTNDRNVVGERGLGGFEEGWREQAGEGDENRALPDPPERGETHALAREFQRRDADEEREYALSQITSEKMTWMTRPL